MKLLYYILTSLFVSGLHGANILSILPFPVRSSRQVYSNLMEELIRRGHQLTIISPFKEDGTLPSVKHIYIAYPLEDVEDLRSTMMDYSKNRIGYTMQVWYRGLSECHHILGNPQVQKLINSKHLSYDLLLLQHTRHECLLGLAHKFQVPVVNFCSFVGSTWMWNRIGNPYPYAYAPYVGNIFTDHMNFWQRIMNTIDSLGWTLFYELHIIPKQEAIMRQYFNNSESLPALWELTHNTSLFMTNSHFSINYPKPLVPNLIELGGLHLKPPKKLPLELQKLLDDASEGVIYFSLGTGLKASNLPSNMVNVLLEAFSKVKQKILWKWEADWLPETSSNVKLIKWLPQSDTLAHQNVRLFITHGGLLSFQEAIYHGVPILGVPFYVDQFQNIGKGVDSGFCVYLDTANISTDSVLWAINTALEPKYRENAQRMSRIFRDQPLTPLEKAVYWTEYVIRHKGARHMRSAALELTWYQYFLIDVIAILALFVTCISLFLFKLIRALVRLYLFAGTVRSATKKTK